MIRETVQRGCLFSEAYQLRIANLYGLLMRAMGVWKWPNVSVDKTFTTRVEKLGKWDQLDLCWKPDWGYMTRTGKKDWMNFLRIRYFQRAELTLSWDVHVVRLHNLSACNEWSNACNMWIFMYHKCRTKSLRTSKGTPQQRLSTMFHTRKMSKQDIQTVRNGFESHFCCGIQNVRNRCPTFFWSLRAIYICTLYSSADTPETVLGFALRLREI